MAYDEPKIIGRLRTGWLWTNVPVKMYSDLGLNDAGWKITGSYYPGWVFPFSILNPGHIRIVESYMEHQPTLAHEIQHARDSIDPKNLWHRLLLSRVGRSYWRELRGEVREISHYPPSVREEVVGNSMARMRTIRNFDDAVILFHLERMAGDLGFDLWESTIAKPVEWR